MSRTSAGFPVVLFILLLPGARGHAATSDPVSPTGVLARLAGHQGGVSFPPAPDGPEPDADRTLAPYFVVAGGDGQSERLPLEETSADITVAGVIARVQVHQLFTNRGGKPIEALYVFPASTRAAVHGMRMRIGTRVIEARIDRREAARQTYDAARRQGRRASLLEQERPNVFTMSVANVMPGDHIAVELDYSELLVPDNATYELVYPTVVGPRYGGGAHPARDTWIANPYLPQGQPQPNRFDVRVHLETGIAIKELSSPSHDVKIAYASPQRADVTLDRRPGKGDGGDHDFVLRYRLSGDRIETGALLWQGESAPGQREGFFAVMVEPPVRPAQAQIPAREYVFLLDVSGSMNGFPLDTAKTLMRNLLGGLQPGDTFNVVLFAGAAATLDPQGSLEATAANIARGLAFVDAQKGGGGTELMGGLQACYRIPRRSRNTARSVVVVTDGYVGVEAQAFRFIRERLGEANLFAFGIGSSVNRGLIEGMARAGLGEPFVVLRPETAAASAEKLRAYIAQPVLTDIRVTYQGLDAYEVAPAHLPDLMARRPLVLHGKFRGAAGGRIVVTGTTGGGRFEKTIALSAQDLRPENGALRWLWARKWAEILEDEHHMGGGAVAEEAITGLGLRYSMLTAYTSFVAADSAVVNGGGVMDSVKQPLPLPQGVSGYAVGAMAAPTPAPATALAPRLRRMQAARPASDEPLEGLELDDEEKADGPPAPSIRLDVTRSSGLGDPGALVEWVRLLASGPGRRCLQRGVIALELTVDGAGKVVKVDVVRGDRRLLHCLTEKLQGAVTATRATGPARGVLALDITLG